jgi:hypothetical protein
MITSLTYGAPAAHSLGFKNGGLNDIISKLNKLKSTKLRDRLDSNEASQANLLSSLSSGNVEHGGGHGDSLVSASSLSSSASSSFMGDIPLQPMKGSKKVYARIWIFISVFSGVFIYLLKKKKSIFTLKPQTSPRLFLLITSTHKLNNKK